MECLAGDVHMGEQMQQLLSVEVYRSGSGGGEGYGLPLSDERAKVGRQPRWSRHETLVLIEAKRVEEVKWSKMKEERERGIETIRSMNSDSKWLSISAFCERHGVMRSAAQCRKRWCNLSADYKRIRDWQSLRGMQPFWLMSNDVRKDNKLPGCFDREVFDSLDKCLARIPCATPDIIFDSGHISATAADESLFSDIEHPLHEEEIEASPENELMESSMAIESPPIETPEGCHSQWPFNAATGEEKFQDQKYPVGTCQEENALALTGGRKKRKRPLVVGENDDFKNQLFTSIEHSSRILTAHVESQNINSEMDRNQRKEHADNLVAVLGKLADALAKIAEKL